MKTTKRLLALVLCVVMVFGMIPVQAKAASDAVMVEHNGETTYYADLQKAFDGFAPENYTYGGTYVVTLLGDVNGKLSKNLQYPSEELDVTLDLNGHTITGDGTSRAVNINLGSNATGITSATFTLKDSSGDNSGTITGGAGGMYVYGSNLVFNFESGTVTGNHGANKGGGILVGDKVYFRMTGGVITGNSVTGTSSPNTGLGGGICGVNMTITGGAIYGNSAIGGSGNYTGRGGGVCTEIGGTKGYHSVVIGAGAQIYGNSASNAGDDVFIAKNSSHSANLTFSISTENWYIDGMNGQNQTSALIDRFNVDDPVPYTEGGWAEGTKKAVGLKYYEDPYDGPIYMITYTDGVEDEVVFADQTYKGRIDKATPAFKGTPERYGYVFAGWDPEVEEIPSKDTVYTAKWTPLTPYTVTYTDGVEDEEVFADQVYNTYDTYATPAFEGTPAREHYIFTGWTPVLADTVTETVTYVATWREAVAYTVTYTDGVEGEEIFADQIFQVEEQQATPTYTFDGKRPGYYFSSWTPTVAKIVTGDATYTAKWTTCTHTNWGTPVFDEEKLTNTYTCVKCGEVKITSVVAEINGTYYETLQAALTSQARTNGDVTVKLLTDTTECVTMTWYQKSTGQNLTIDLNGHTITGTGSASVLKFTRSGNTISYKWNIIIDDTSAEKTGTITGGKGASGGAIYVSGMKTNDSLTINGGNFTGNTATSNGGAIYGTTIIINGGTFKGNTATANGGAISGTTITINGGTFKGNTANNTTYGGGAVYCSSTLTVTGGTFTGNTAVNGGAIYVTASKPIVNLTGGAIYGNTATGYGDDIVFKCTGSTAPTFNLMAAADMGVEGITGWYVDGYYIAAKADRYSQTVALYEAPASLTKTTLALKAATHYTITYVDGVENEVVFEDHIVLAAPNGATPEFVPEREGYTFLGWDPAVAETVTADAVYVAQWLENIRGTIDGVAFRDDNEGVSLELNDILARETIAVKVYAGETLLTTVSLRDIEDAKQFLGVVCDALTVSIRTYDESTYWAATEWVPFVDLVPTKYELYIDGQLMDTLEETVDVEKWNALKGTIHPDQLVVPEAPKDNGSNVTAELITVVCDSDLNHTSSTYGWEDPAANFVFPVDSEPVWNEELKAWTISVRIDSINTYYVNLRFSKEHNGIQHNITDGNSRIDTTLVWDSANKVWTTLTGKAFEVHVACQTAPEAPSMGYHLSKFQIKMVGTVDGAEKVWFETLHADTLTVGEVKGNRVDGFTVDITVTLDGSYPAVWNEKHSNGPVYTYAEETPATVVFTMRYTGDTTGELYDGPSYWAVEGNRNYTVNLVPDAPDAPTKFGDNVTPDLVQVICDSDPEHAPMNIKWQHQSTKVYPGAVAEWDAELAAWKIKVRIDSVSVHYVWLNYEKAHNEIVHAMVDEDQQCIDTYLKWDEEKQLWVTLDGQPIPVHVTCQTKPVAPTTSWLGRKNFQIQVKGDLDGNGVYGEKGELYAASGAAESWTVGEVYGSRTEGFFVDVTLTLENGDKIINTWIEQKAPGMDYVYNWDLTQKSITITLKYTRGTTGTLYGDNESDWVNAATGEIYGKIGEAFVVPAPPAAPEQANVTDKLVAIICDSDGQRHETVYGKWYPLGHCQTTSDMVWDEDLKTWTVDIRIGSLYIMYVDQLEDANNGTIHELVDDITTVYSTLVWDTTLNLWVPEAPIELHTTCRTAPIAPVYKQLKGYQIKVKGNLDGDDVWGESKATNNGVLEQYTTTIPENGYTMGQVYGSREEGFFVDVTVTLEDGDVYLANWIAQCDPCRTYVYDWNKTEKTVTFTLKYNGSLSGTLYGDRHAANTNYDWVLVTGKHYGVVSEAYVAVDENGATYHVFESVVTDPTCTEGGYTTHTCSVCGLVVVDSKIDALGHKMSAWTVTVKPTFTTEGERVRHCENGCGYTETEVVPKLVLLADPAITKLENTATGIKITWGKVPGAERYRVYVKENGAWKNLGNTTGTTFTYTGVENGKSYTFTVRCVTADNSDFTSNYNKTGWTHTFVEPPVITNMESATNGVKITWTAVEGAGMYRVYVKDNGKWVSIGHTTRTTFTYEEAVPGVTYTFTVRARNANNSDFLTGYYADRWSHKFSPVPAITKLEDTAKGVKITWTAINGAGKYRVYMKNAEGKWISIGHTTGTSLTYTGAKNGETYTFTVRARNADDTAFLTAYNTTGWTHTYSAVPNVTKVESTAKGIKLTWNAINGAGKYRVYVKNAEGKWISVGSTTGTSFTYTAAKLGETYTFTVRARNANDSDFLTSYNKTGWTHTYAPIPGLTKVENVSGGIKLTWDAVNGVEKYRIFVKKTNGGWATVGNTTGTSFTYTAAKSGVSYTFTIRGVSADGTTYTTGYNSTGWTIVCK